MGKWKAVASIGALTLAASYFLGSACITERPGRTPASWKRQHLEKRFVERMTDTATPLIIKDEESYTIEKITLRKATTDSITIDYYRTKGDAPRPLIIISPILDGHYEIESLFTKDFAQHNFDVALIERRNADNVRKSDDIAGTMQKEMLETIKEYQRAIDYLSMQPHVRTDRLCGLGLSFGGMKDTIVAAIDPRLRYNAIVISGSLDKVIAGDGIDNLMNGIVRKHPERSARFWKKHGGKQHVLDELHKRVPLQPQYFAQGLDPQRTLFVSARFDSIINETASDDLWNRAGKPERLYLLGGHFTSLYLAEPYPFLQHKCLDFFKEKIAQDDHLK